MKKPNKLPWEQCNIVIPALIDLGGRCKIHTRSWRTASWSDVVLYCRHLPLPSTPIVIFPRTSYRWNTTKTPSTSDQQSLEQDTEIKPWNKNTYILLPSLEDRNFSLRTCPTKTIPTPPPPTFPLTSCLICLWLAKNYGVWEPAICEEIKRIDVGKAR